jgi:hypothetical protein
MSTKAREELLAHVDRNFKKYAAANYPMVLAFFEEAKVKRDLMKAFVACFDGLARHPGVDIDRIVVKTMERTAAKSIDKEFFAGLLNRAELSDRTRQKILAVINGPS